MCFCLVIFKRYLCDAGDELFGDTAITLVHLSGSDLRVTNGKEETDLSQPRWKWKYGKWIRGRLCPSEWKRTGEA